MLKSLFIFAYTVVFAAIGFYLSQMLHETTARILLATCAGAIGGFGISCAASHVLSLWQSQHKGAQRV